MSRRGAWVTLVLGLLAVFVAACLTRQDTPPASSTPTGSASPAATRPTATSTRPTPSPTSSRSTPPAPAAWTVRYVDDGDTLDLARGPVRIRVRLVNINAPERTSPEHAGQCLAELARGTLARLTPVGSSVELRTFGKDRFGRTVAAVHGRGGVLVNAEVVRAGMAAPLVVAGQVPVLREVRAAQAEAAAAKRGLHTARSSCTVPGRLAALRTQLDGIPPTGADRVTRLAAVLRGARAVLAELDADLPWAGVAALTREEQAANRAAALLLIRQAGAAGAP